MPRQRWTEGSIVRVALAGGQFSFGRLLPEPLVEFFDLVHIAPEVDVARLQNAGVVFRLWVVNSAITSGRWPKVGTWPLTSAEDQAEDRFFRQDAISGELYLVIAGRGQEAEIPATRAECVGLERAAVWSAVHVEDRLQDHFDGVPSKWVESLRLT